ncbi:MAG: hypothetical protein LIO93_07280 [Bacteroidales bacterium]|nr:hypothetical protein [Bacteroidales bacterium]
MKSIQYIVLFFSAVFFTLPMYAQTGNSQLEREMTLEREYNPSLRDANKINQLPQVKEPEAPKTQVEFSNFLLDYNIPPYLSNLKAKSYFSDYATSNKRGYLNVGVSSLLDIDGDFGYQILNSSKDCLSLYFSHRSSNSDVTYLQTDTKQKMKLNDNLGGIDFNHNFEKVKFIANAQYIYSAFNYYGVNRSSDPFTPIPDHFISNSTKQVNNLFHTRLGIQSLQTEKVSYYLNVHYALFSQKYGFLKDSDGKTENQFGADFDVTALTSSTLGIGVGGDIRYNTNKTPYYSDEKYNYTVGSLNPHIDFYGDNWDLRLGASGTIQHESGDNEFTVAPDVKFNWRPSDPYLFYVNVGGGVYDNSNYNMYFENRYVLPDVRIKDSRNFVDGLLGFKFSLLPELNIDIFTGYKISEDEPFFYNSAFFWHLLNNETYILGELLEPDYLKAKVFKLGGAVDYSYQDIFDLGIKLTYYNWDTDHDNKGFIIDWEPTYEPEPWNKPQFTADARIGFKVPSIPFRIDLNYHLETGRKAMTAYSTNNAITKMKNMHALNAKVNYAINDSFSVFAQANNLLFQEYDIWYGYPAQDFNIMGGLSVKF